MLKFLIFSFMLLNSLISIFTWHPLKMAIIVFFQTILTCTSILMMNKTPWFSYILLLVFIGGLLILFSYMTIIASNEMIKINMNTYLAYYFIILISMMIMIIFDKIQIHLNLENLNVTWSFNSNKNMFSMMKLYNNFSYLLNFIIMNYLLITLITSNKIINIFKGPLRMMN